MPIKKNKKKQRPVSSLMHSPNPRRSLSINTSRTPTTPSRKSPSNTKTSVKRSETSSSRDKLTSKASSSQKPSTQMEYLFPKHIEVIERLRKIKNFSQNMPFSPEIPPAVMRNFHIAYSKPSFSLVNRIQKRKEKADFDVLEDKSMEILLKRIKETERIIRQENGFVGKIRRFKPKIKLVKSFKGESGVREKIVKRVRNNTPGNILRSGIQAKNCYKLD